MHHFSVYKILCRLHQSLGAYLAPCGSFTRNVLWKIQMNFLSNPCLSHKVIVRIKSESRVQLFATPWTVAYQAPLSMGFSRQEYWGGLPFPSPGDLPNPGIEPRSPAL